MWYEAHYYQWHEWSLIKTLYWFRIWIQMRPENRWRRLLVANSGKCNIKMKLRQPMSLKLTSSYLHSDGASWITASQWMLSSLNELYTTTEGNVVSSLIAWGMQALFRLLINFGTSSALWPCFAVFTMAGKKLFLYVKNRTVTNTKLSVLKLFIFCNKHTEK